jgi:hypothetical protein
MKRLRTLRSFQVFKIKIKNLKPIAVDVFFKAYPILILSFLHLVNVWTGRSYIYTQNICNELLYKFIFSLLGLLTSHRF